MNSYEFQLQVERERAHFSRFENTEYGEYSYLVSYFVTTFRYIEKWEEEIMPYLQSLQEGTGKIDDWGSFAWGGRVCFRYNYVMILDEELVRSDKRTPFLKDDNGELIVNKDYEALYDTEFIETNYTEFVKVSLSELINVCFSWMVFIS